MCGQIQLSSHEASVFKDTPSFIRNGNRMCHTCLKHMKKGGYCGDCKLVRYCSKACQKKDSERHSSICKDNVMHNLKAYGMCIAVATMNNTQLTKELQQHIKNALKAGIKIYFRATITNKQDASDTVNGRGIQYSVITFTKSTARKIKVNFPGFTHDQEKEMIFIIDVFEPSTNMLSKAIISFSVCKK